MSGVEAVIGIVLGIFPLVISGLEHYRDGVRLLRRWRAFEREVKDLIVSLQTEEALFVNCWERLLNDVVPIDMLEELLKNPAGVDWSTYPDLERKLRDRLWRAETFDVYMAQTGMMRRAIEEFRDRLGIDEQGKVR
jgi:hypothetical protein